MSNKEKSTAVAVSDNSIDLEYGEKQIAVLADSSKGIDLSTPEGYESAKQVIRSAKKMRSGVESSRKKLKAFYLEEGRKIDSKARRLVELIEEFEKPLAIEKKKIDNAEAEAKRKKAEAAEAKRLEAERVEREKVEAQQRAENERIRKEQEAENARLAAERKAIEDEREAIRKEREKIQAERDRVEAEKQEAERLERERKEAKEQAERDRLQAIEDERIESERVESERLAKVEAEQKAEADRLEAERLAEERKPDRQKLIDWLEEIDTVIVCPPSVKTEWAQSVIDEVTTAARLSIRVSAMDDAEVVA